MDSLTHIVLGACTGELIAGKKLGKKAMVLGALAQSIPDFDFIASFWMNTSDDLLAHRGITHSWFFAVLLTPLLVWVSLKLQRKPGPSAWQWALLWGGEMAIHLLLDACNAYGTAWWLPFSRERIAFHLLFVADPLFTIWPLIAAVVLVIVRKKAPIRIPLALVAVAISLSYTAMSGVHKHGVDEVMHKAAREQGIQEKRYFSSPTAFNTALWYVVVESDSGYYIGYRSIFDRQAPDSFCYFARNESLLKEVTDTTAVNNLKIFSNNFYVVNRQTDTLVFHDLRFGQMKGWQDPHSPFTFYYYLDYPLENQLIIQRGRFANWTRPTVDAFLERIKGK